MRKSVFDHDVNPTTLSYSAVRTSYIHQANSFEPNPKKFTRSKTTTSARALQERAPMSSLNTGKSPSSPQKRWLAPTAIIAIAIFVSVLMKILSPPPESKDTPDKAMLVSALQVEKQDMTIAVPSQGRVAPHTRTTLISEVAGTVIEVSEQFVSGGFVQQDQLLLKLEDRNYLAAVKQAEANVARASKDFIQEKGQAQVAYEQYKKSKGTKRTPEALSLLLREPQLKESEANLEFAKAELERVKGDLEKTEIRAPYDGLIKKKFIDIGQYASRGTNVAELIAIDYAEVRLAIPQDRLAYMDLPMITVAHTDQTGPNSLEQIAQAPVQHDEAIPVMLTSMYGDVEYEWPAKIVRTEGFFDETSHTLYAVARIDDPYMLKTPRQFSEKKQVPLLMGTYVEASIQGHKLQDMVKIPRHLLRAGNHVWVIDENNQLRNRQLEILRTGGDLVYVTSGLEQGERICLTNVGEVVPGTIVRIADEQASETTKTAMLSE